MEFGIARDLLLIGDAVCAALLDGVVDEEGFEDEFDK